jgi:tripartite motif-containing protein 71
MDIMRREIARINNQIRRGIHRLQDALSVVEKNSQSLQTNCHSVSEEIDEVYRRLTKALKDRTDHLRSEMDKYLTSEMKNLTNLKENLELEISNITSNCDLADKFMTDSVEWDDCELMDTKEIFLKTVEFIRNFETETSDYSRRVRLTMHFDPNQLVSNLSTFGDLNITHPPQTTANSGSMLQPPSAPGLMRSKSDHRLATQFRQQEAQNANDDEPLLGGRKFGERPKPTAQPEKYGTESRYGRGNDYDYNEYDNDSSLRSNKSRFRSRFVRGHQGGDDSDDDTSSRSVKFQDKTEKGKDKITTTEDVAKGPLSGIFRIQDSPRVIKRLQEQEKGFKEKKEAVKSSVTVTSTKPTVQVQQRPKTATRQMSEDEIDRLKRQNKGTPAAQPTAVAPSTPPVPEERPAQDRLSILKKPAGTAATSDDSDTATTSPAARRTQQRVEVLDLD